MKYRAEKQSKSVLNDGGSMGFADKHKHEDTSGQADAPDAIRVRAVMAAAERSGLLQEKSSRIGGRISPALIRQAKAQTGIETDTDLIEFALANVALDDRFAESLKAVRGTVDPALDLGF